MFWGEGLGQEPQSLPHSVADIARQVPGPREDLVVQLKRGRDLRDYPA